LLIEQGAEVNAQGEDLYGSVGAIDILGTGRGQIWDGASGSIVFGTSADSTTTYLDWSPG
jgi:hypothetical protein